MLRVTSIFILAVGLMISVTTGVWAESQYKIVHKDQVAEDFEIHADYPIFERLNNKELQDNVNHQIVDKLESTFRRIKRGARETMGIPYLYYEETNVIKEKDFYSVVMTSHISRGERYNSTVTSVNFMDSYGGEMKSLKELVYIDRLNKEVKKALEADSDMSLKEPFAGVRDNTAFYVQDNKIVLVFNKFEVAAGVHGTPEISIPLNGLLKEDINKKSVPLPSYT